MNLPRVGALNLKLDIPQFNELTNFRYSTQMLNNKTGNGINILFGKISPYNFIKLLELSNTLDPDITII